MPADGRDARAEFEAAHIPGARFFDIDEISDDQSDLPHMAPPVEKFVSRMRAMGIGDGHRVVVYDSAGLFSAAAGLVAVPPVRQDRRRGARRRPAEVARRGPPGRGHAPRSCATATSPPAATPASCATSPRSRPPPSSATPRSSTPARADRFRGEAPEPRPGLRSGHIPGAKNVPYGELLNPDGTHEGRRPASAPPSRPPASTSTKPVITTCGSGVSAGDPQPRRSSASATAATRSTTAPGPSGAPTPT